MVDGRTEPDQVRGAKLALDALTLALVRAAAGAEEEADADALPSPPPASRPRRLRGRAADEATTRFIALAEQAGIEIQRLGPGRWVVGGRVLYNPPTGRIRLLPHGRTLPRRGLAALGDVLADLGPGPGAEE